MPACLPRYVYALVLCSCITVACEPGPDDGPVATEWEAILTGANVIPPVSTTATGRATVHLAGNAFDFTITVSNLSGAESALLHVGLANTNGSARLLFCAPCVPTADTLATGRATVSLGSFEALVNSMRAYATYIEVRTAAGPVLRGQFRLPEQ